MRALLQRVTRAGVRVDGEDIASIGPGLLVFLGVADGDSKVEADWLAEKVANLRIFSDADDKMNLSLIDIKGQALVVSQFTLYGDCRRGRRPGFELAAKPDQANELYEYFKAQLAAKGPEVSSGRFAANMAVSLVNDGPVTFIIDTPDK